MSGSSSNSSCSCFGCFGFLVMVVVFGSSIVGGTGFFMKLGPFAASFSSGARNDQSNRVESNQPNSDSGNLEKEVLAEFSKFHDSLDKGNFKGIYERSNNQLQVSTSEEDFLQVLQKIQSLCGKSKSSELLNVWKPIAGSQTGPYLLSRHLTVFEKSSFIEEFTWLSSSGKLTLLNFHFIPPSAPDQIPTKKT